MQQIEPIGAFAGSAGLAAGGVSAVPLYLATEQPSSVVTRMMLGANVLAEAALSIPPTPAALLDISPAAAGLVPPVVTLSNHVQLLLLDEQSLEMIFTDAAHAALPQPLPIPLPSAPAVTAPALPGATLDSLA